MPPERFLRARYDVGIGVDLVGRADPAGSLGWLGRWRAEDGVPHHRQPRGVDHGLIVVERHHVRADEDVQGQRLRGGIGRVLADGIDQVDGAG
jgi:hypothetical protein